MNIPQENHRDKNSENESKPITLREMVSSIALEKRTREEESKMMEFEEISDSDEQIDLFYYNNPMHKKPQTSIQQKAKRDVPSLPVEPKTLPVPQPKIQPVPEPPIKIEKKELQYDNIPALGFYSSNPKRPEKQMTWRDEIRVERELQDALRLPQKYKGPGLQLVKKFEGFLKRACQNQKSKLLSRLDFIIGRVLEKEQFSSTLSLVLVFVETDKIEMLKPSESRQIYIIMNECRDLLRPGKFLKIYSPALTSAFKFVLSSDKRKYPGKLYMALEYEQETNL